MGRSVWLICASFRLATSYSIHPNRLLEVRVTNNLAYSSFSHLEEALTGAAEQSVSGVLIVIEDGEGGDNGDARVLESMPTAAARIAMLEREHLIREWLRQAALSMPVIAVSTGRQLDGVCAGLALAAGQRIVTERTMISLQGCRLGLLPSGISLLSALAPEEQRPLAMAFALGALRLSMHDASHLHIARFVPSNDVPDLLSELRCAPSTFLDVPLTRRCRVAPAMYANLFVEGSPLEEALDHIFGQGSCDAAEVLCRLKHEADRTAKLLHSHSWRTRECAEQVDAVLGEAATSLHTRHSSPSALAATFVVLRMCFEAVEREGGVACNHHLEHLVNARLAARDDFGEGLRACPGQGGGSGGSQARFAGMVARAHVPRWEPSTMDGALAVADTEVAQARAEANEIHAIEPGE